jgi:serine/threonine protein kinase
MHGNNIIHRDIKPENIIIDQKGYLRLTDMGIAKVVEK